MKLKIMINVAISCATVLIMNSCGIYSVFQKPVYGFENNACGQIDSLIDESAKVPTWRQFFQDPTLSALIDSALIRNSSLSIAKLKVDEAQASLSASKLAFLPALDISAKTDYSSSSSGWTLQLPANASWQVDLFGSLRNAKQQKKAQLMQSKDYVKAVQADLISTIAITYYTLEALDCERDIYIRTRDNWKKNVEVTRSLMEAGQYTQAALSQAEAEYYSICNSVISIENEISSVQNTLCGLMGTTPQYVSRDSLDSWKLPEIASVGIPVNILSARPDVREAQDNLEAAFYLTNEARSAFYPSITLSGSLDLDKNISTAIASLTQPLFQRGSLTANYKTAAARQHEAESTFRQTLVEAGIEVNDCIREIQAEKRKSEYCGLRVESLKRAVQSTDLLMQHGSTTYLEVLTAQRSLLSAQIEQTSNILNEISYTVSLYQAMGGGSE